MADFYYTSQSLVFVDTSNNSGNKNCNIVRNKMKQKIDQIKVFVKDNYKGIIFFICIISLIFLIEDVMDKDIMDFDEKGYLIVSKYLISENRNHIAKFITNFANMFWLIGISILLLIVIENKKIGISIFLNLPLSALTNFILKQILQRPRPVGHRIIDESGYSLPSGHSMVSMAFYGYLIYLIYKNIKNKKLKIFLILFLSMLIMSIGISRIYLGVHYSSDVVAGFLVAIAYLLLYIKIMKMTILKDQLIYNNKKIT